MDFPSNSILAELPTFLPGVSHTFEGVTPMKTYHVISLEDRQSCVEGCDDGSRILNIKL